MPDAKQTPRPLIPEFKRIAAQEVVTQEDDPTFGGNFDDAHSAGYTAGEVDVAQFALPALTAAREAIERLAQIVVGLDGGHDIDNPKQSSCGFGMPKGFCENCEALVEARAALEGLGGEQRSNPPSG